MKWIRDDNMSSQNEILDRQHSTSTEELARMYGVGPGVRIHSVHHRQQPSILSSQTSSSVSVATNAGSQAALLHTSRQKKPNKKKNLQNYYKQNAYDNRNNNSRQQREFNSLLASAGLFDKNRRKDKPKKISTASNIQFISGYGEEPELEDSINATRAEVKYRLQNAQPNLLPVILAALTISLGSCVVGFSTAYTSPALPSMNASDSTVRITKVEESWIGSLMPLSALFGGIAGGPLIEGLGRKTTILLTAIPFLLSFTLISFAPSVLFIMAGRSLSGFCVGICSLALPVYLGETVQPEVRGTLGLLPTTFGNIGMLLCFTAGNFVDWRMLALLGATIPIPFLICMFLIPETPQWYITRNQGKKARKALQWLRGPETDVSQEFDEIEKSSHNNGKNQDAPGFTSLFSRMYIRPLFISLGLMFFQQMSGINAFMFYTVQIFKDAGSTLDHHISTIIVGLVNFFSTFLATIFIDRLGRKVLLCISSVTISIMLFLLGLYFHFREMGYNVSQYGWVPLFCFISLVLGFSIGFGPIPWLMMGEILPVRIRGSAASLATAFNWGCTFVITKTFHDLQDWIGKDGSLWLFGTLSFLGLFFVIFCVPETQGKSLEDIERNLTGGQKGPVRHVRRMSSIAHLKPLPMAV